MQLFLTSVLPFLAHDHASAVAFLTCRHHNFHASIIPEFLSNEDRVKSFCKTRQQYQLKADIGADIRKHYANLYHLFVQTPLMQFSPSLVFFDQDCAESIFKPLLETKYFRRTLQRCSVTKVREEPQALSTKLLQYLSKVQSLTMVDLAGFFVEDELFYTMLNTFPSIKALTLSRGPCVGQFAEKYLDFEDTKPINYICSPLSRATKTLRSLTLCRVQEELATDFISHLPNLRKLELLGWQDSCDLQPLSSSLPLLTDLTIDGYWIDNVESLKNLVYLSSVAFKDCNVDDLSFLTQEKSLLHLSVLTVQCCQFPNSSPNSSPCPNSAFASLLNAPNLQVLEIYPGDCSFEDFNSNCFQYLENMFYLRKLTLNCHKTMGDRRSLKTLMQNSPQLEELDLSACWIGNEGAIAGALYRTHSRLRVLKLDFCKLVDDDLHGIGALKNTLEELALDENENLTNEALVHCKDLVKLKKLSLNSPDINDLSPLKDCLNLETLFVFRTGIWDLSPLIGCKNLEKLYVGGCYRLTDDSFKIFSVEPNSFPNLRSLVLSSCEKLTEKVLEHLSKNNHLVYQLQELDVWRMGDNSSPLSATARNNIYELKGLRRLKGMRCSTSESDQNKIKDELQQRLKNLEEI